MFDEIQFEKINRLPKYIFAEINDIKMEARRAGEDIIDFSMGNPDAPTPKPIVDKLCETAKKKKTHGYSASKGIYKLRLAMSNWYKRKYGVDLDPNEEVVATMGSKEGYVHLVQAISNPGDVAIVPDPTYPIHSQAFVLAGANVEKMEVIFDEETFEVDEDRFLADVVLALENSVPKAKFLVVNFPHNPSTATVTLEFYEKLVALAKEKRFYIISDIAYADITFDGYTTPSIMEVEGAKDVASRELHTIQELQYGGVESGLHSGQQEAHRCTTEYQVLGLIMVCLHLFR